MKIATTILVHNSPDIVQDTIESVKTWITKDILVIVDEASWGIFQNLNFGVPMDKGYRHAFNRSPYRNYTLAIRKLYEMYPNNDWYCFLEYDCLVVSDFYKKHLNNAWVIGNDHRVKSFDFPHLKSIVDLDYQEAHYFLGCTHFLHHDFIVQLAEINAFKKIEEQTKAYDNGYFPGYTRHAFEEELFPTMAVALGGKIKEMACWTGLAETGNIPGWRGDPSIMARFKPAITPDEILPSTSILHPVKDLGVIRRHYKEARSRINKL